MIRSAQFRNLQWAFPAKLTKTLAKWVASGVRTRSTAIFAKGVFGRGLTVRATGAQKTLYLHAFHELRSWRARWDSNPGPSA